MGFGIIVGHLMNAIWIYTSIGALPLGGSNISLFHAYNQGLSTTILLNEKIHSSLFETSAFLFALTAIVTSYIATSLGLLGFNNDLLKFDGLL